MPNAIQTPRHVRAGIDVAAEMEDVPAVLNVLAARGTRLVAVVIDGLFGLLLVLLPLIRGVGTHGLRGVLQGDSTTLDAVAASGMMALFGLILWAGLNFHFVNQNGQSIGKKMMGIKVVRSDGSTAGVARIFWLRNVVGGGIGVIPLAGPLYAVIDAFMLFSAPRRCLHDRIADTIVIKA